MNETVTFARLHDLLTGLGFKRRVIPGPYVVYEHPESDTLIVMRDHKPSEAAPWATVASTKHQLIWRGLIEPEELERQLHAARAG